jgi:hypothetical protein
MNKSLQCASSESQQELAIERNQHIYGYQEALRNRQQIESEAARTSDPDEQAALRDQWHFYDTELQRCEQEVRRLTPRQVTPLERKQMAFMQKNAPFLQREGQRGVAAMDLAHNYLVSRGHNPNARGFNEKVRSLLEMYGGNLQQLTGGQVANVRYDPQEQALTANEAAKLSGLSPERYNQYVRAVHAAGKMSYQERK